MKDLYLDGDLFYTTWSGEGDVDWDARDFALTGGVKWFLPLQTNMLDLYTGAGIGMHFLKTEWDAGAWGSGDDSESEFGFYFMGGMEFPLSPQWNIAGEFRYDMPSDDDNNFGTLSVGGVYKFSSGGGL